MLLRGLLAASIGLAVVAKPGAARADAAQVEALIAKGNDLRRAGTPGPALPYFLKAYQLARTPRTAGQLGLAELAAGYPVEAAEHLAAALQSPNDPSIVKYRKMLSDALTNARSQIGELAISGSPAGAEVEVNGRVAGVLPLAATLELAARTTEVIVRAPGFLERRSLVPITGGQRHHLTVNLEKVPAAPAPILTPAPGPPAIPRETAPSERPTQAQPSTDPRSPEATATSTTLPLIAAADSNVINADSKRTVRRLAWVVGAAAAASITLGAVEAVVYTNRIDRFNQHVGPSLVDPSRPSLNCGADEPNRGGPGCETLYDDASFSKALMVAGFAAGAMLAVGSVALFVVSTPSRPERKAAVIPTCAPGFAAAGFLCRVTF